MDALATKIEDELNNNSNKTLTATYDVQYRAGNGYIEFKLSGGASGESARILTDQELRDQTYHAPHHTIRAVAIGNWRTTTWRAHRRSGRPRTWSHTIRRIDFIILHRLKGTGIAPIWGKRVYPDPLTVVAGYQFGTYNPVAKTITWGPA